MTGKLRIVHIGNGRAFKIKSIIHGLQARGHDIHMIPIPPCPQSFDGVTWHEMPDSSLPGQAKVLHRMLQIRRLVKSLKPDVVHSHNAWGPGWYGAFTGRHPFVIHGYGGDLLPEQYRNRPALQRRLTSWACRSADQVIVTGKHMVDASRLLGIRPDRITLLPRGVDLKRYRAGLDVSDLRQQLGLAGNGPVVLSPRYQVDEALYNLDTVIAAFARFRERFPSAVCIQMYESERTHGADALRQLADEHHLGASYRLVPSVANEQMPLYYNLADMALSVPSSDGFPVTVLEASACECPLIVSALPYCKEWFVPRQNGLIVPPRDPAALAGAMSELHLNADLSHDISAAGRRLVETRANYEHCMEKLESLYHRLLNEMSSRHQGRP